ncbi:DUF1028 domain-containing protein [Pseudonocardia asaccharolytica]|uniref:Uncharacterized protein n=1 Tax=Pseudonocardia asaccharolytica DSM 44247 = NBRC 16224 TaxID=1123024 RepID=A0A511D0R9_9PSEU|nr:DUF1028 domain-containing protein [Pseudonocardia asaccharolytica]GEL18123.1 hypothetical protein PA7_19600 [Pseudonocardia asaccharolytica DSM 44247 = NBRC 16224]
MTYSIVARDPDSGALGVAVQSHYLACGSVVAWAQAGVGAVATQSVVEVGYGPDGLRLMDGGAPAPEALARLLAGDAQAAVRQVAMVDADGRAAVHTGPGCVGAAGHRIADGVSAQANMVADPAVWEAMIAAYGASAEPDLAGRLLAALDAAETAGGDLRGRQSAAILAVGGERGARPWDGRLVDLRVDEDLAPLSALRRLLDVQRATARMTGVLFSGVLFASSPSHGEVDAALTSLTAAQDGLDGNREPTFWAAVLLARAGRAEEARRRLAQATAEHPGWAPFVHRVAAAGLLTPDQAAALRG